ncbi:MAG: GatB/YqeY domain-containing protein [Patescibacteria group bacterium]|nr:GatB/YqeY domain-containing protein [Patescibacteria group bacterium]
MLKEQVQLDLTAAQKAREEQKVSTLRMLVAAFNNMEIAKRGKADVSEDDYMTVVKQEAKKRKEAIEAYKVAGRAESQALEEAELEILAAYLPEQMSEDELKSIVDAVVEEKGIDNMGLIIGEVMKRAQGRADGGVVSKLVREKLG